MKISELITDKYKLRIPPTVYYDLLADVVEVEEEQEPTTKNDLGVDCIRRKEVDRIINKWLSHPDYELKDHIYSMTEKIHNLPSVTPQEPTDKNFTKADIDAIVKAINAHWELIIDEIRAEIKGMTPTYHNPDWSITDLVPISEVLKLLDKYKADRSEEE